MNENTKRDTLVEVVRSAMDAAILKAHNPSGVAKQLAVMAVRHMNRCRAEAKKRRPFTGLCEASGLSLNIAHACLEELQSELGCTELRWVCQRANNSGEHSCSAC